MKNLNVWAWISIGLLIYVLISSLLLAGDIPSPANEPYSLYQILKAVGSLFCIYFMGTMSKFKK